MLYIDNLSQVDFVYSCGALWRGVACPVCELGLSTSTQVGSWRNAPQGVCRIASNYSNTRLVSNQCHIVPKIGVFCVYVQASMLKMHFGSIIVPMILWIWRQENASQNSAVYLNFCHSWKWSSIALVISNDLTSYFLQYLVPVQFFWSPILRIVIH